MTVEADVSGWAAQHRRRRQLAARGHLCNQCHPTITTRADIDIIQHQPHCASTCDHSNPNNNGQTEQ